MKEAEFRQLIQLLTEILNEAYMQGMKRIAAWRREGHVLDLFPPKDYSNFPFNAVSAEANLRDVVRKANTEYIEPLYRMITRTALLPPSYREGNLRIELIESINKMSEYLNRMGGRIPALPMNATDADLINVLQCILAFLKAM